MWLFATHKICVQFDLNKCGWIVENQKDLKINWFEGPPTPLSVDDILLSENQDDEEFDVITDDSDDEL